MMLTDFARQYCSDNSLRLTPLHGMNRFCRLCGAIDIEVVTTDHITEFRRLASAEGLSAWTIEKTVTDLLTLLKAYSGLRPDPGKRLKRPRPMPTPAPLGNIDLMMSYAPRWMQQWIVLTYWTGLRLADAIRIQESLPQQRESETLSLRANKTGHVHCWPVPSWLRPWLVPTDFRYPRCRINAGKSVRLGLEAAAINAGCNGFLPKQLRQRGITEWTRANATAGSIVHGCGLGVMAHYLDPLSVLESAAPRVRLPVCFGGTVDSGDQLRQTFERLDQQGRELVLAMAERMAS